MFETLLKLAQGLFSLGTLLRKARKTRREQIAGYLDKISETLTEVGDRFSSGEMPRGTCARLKVYAEQLQTAVGAELGTSVPIEIAELVETVDEVRNLWGFQEHDAISQLARELEVSERNAKQLELLAERSGSPPAENATEARAKYAEQAHEAAGTFKAIADSLRVMA